MAFTSACDSIHTSADLFRLFCDFGVLNQKRMKATVDRCGQWGLAPWKRAMFGSGQIKNISENAYICMHPFSIVVRTTI